MSNLGLVQQPPPDPQTLIKPAAGVSPIPQQQPMLRDFATSDLESMLVDADAAKDQAALDLIGKEIELRRSGSVAFKETTRFTPAIAELEKRLADPGARHKRSLELRLQTAKAAEARELAEGSKGGRQFTAAREGLNPPGWIAPVDAAAHTLAQGLSAGGSDELAGVIKAGEGNPIVGGYRLATGAPGAGVEYERGRYDANEALRAARGKYPLTSAATQVAGEIPLAFATGGGGPLARLGSGTALGAIQGALSAPPGSRGAEAVVGGGLNLGLGALGEAAFGGINLLGRRKAAIPPMPPPATIPGQEAAARVISSTEHGVPLTLGQKTGDVAQQSLEESMRSGGLGFQAQQTIDKFDAEQAAKLAEATGKMRVRIGGAQVTPEEGGEAIMAAIQKRAAELKEQSQAAYTTAAGKEAFVPVEEIKGLRSQIMQDLGAAGIHVDPGNYPGASAAIKVLEQLPGFKASIGAPFAGEGSTITKQALGGIEKARQLLGSTKAANGQDARALGILRDKFDDWLDNAIQNRAFSGDPTALDDLKNARSLWQKYKGITEPRDPNRADKLVAQMAEQGRTGDEVANWLLNHSSAGATADSVRVAQRIRNEFGADSPEVQMLRQSIISKILNPKEGAGLESGNQAISTAIKKFVEGDGKALARSLFTEEERASLMHEANIRKVIKGSDRAKNPSGSGHEVVRAFNRITAGATGAGGGLGGAAFIGATKMGVDPLTAGGIGAVAASVPLFARGVKGAFGDAVRAMQGRVATGGSSEIAPGVRRGVGIGLQELGLRAQDPAAALVLPRARDEQ